MTCKDRKYILNILVKIKKPLRMKSIQTERTTLAKRDKLEKGGNLSPARQFALYPVLKKNAKKFGD